MSIESAITEIAQETGQVIPEPTEVDAPETKDQVWARTARKAPPITKEELRGPETGEPVLPDRSLVAPEITEYLQSKQEVAQDPTTEGIEALRARLEELAAPESEPPTESQVLLEKITALEQRDVERDRATEQRRVEEDEQARQSAFREGVVANINADAEVYPGLIALSLQDNVYFSLYNQLKEGKTVSEADIASKAEQDVWEIYDKLHAIKTKVSDEPTRSVAPQTPITITPDLVANDESWSVKDAIMRGDKRSAKEELWNRINNQ